MIDVKDEKDIAKTMKDNPNETVRWIRPDGWEEYHKPHGMKKVVLPPRIGR